mgnify:CR=1 FL=1
MKIKKIRKGMKRYVEAVKAKGRKASGCLLGPIKRSDCEIWLLKEGKKIFDKFFYVPIPSVIIDGERLLYKDKDLTELDFVLPRIPRSYVRFGYKLLSILKDKVYLPIEPESVLITHNKFLTLLALKEVGLPVPQTFLTASRKAMQALLDDMTFPVVMKVLYGSLGKGVMFADSKEAAVSVMDTLERFKQPIFLEEYVPNPGEDIRIFVLGNEVLGAMKRKAEKDERRANIGIGGTGEPIEIDWKCKDLAVKAAAALGMDVCGIDMIRGPSGPVIIEGNVNVHFEGLTKTLRVNVARAIVEYVNDELSMLGFTRLEKLMTWLKRK